MTTPIPIDLPGLEDALVPGPVFFRMTVAGDPVPKGRHRSRVVIPRGGKPFVHQYPDPDTARYEAMLAQYARLKMRSRPPSESPLSVLVVADLRLPKSWPERDRRAALAGRIMPASRPDGDNYGKAILDSLLKVCYVDDSQVVDLRIIKRYSASPALTIEIREFVVPQGGSPR